MSSWEALGWVMTAIAVVVLIFTVLVAFACVRAMLSDDGPGDGGSTPGGDTKVLRFDV